MKNFNPQILGKNPADYGLTAWNDRQKTAQLIKQNITEFLSTIDARDARAVCEAIQDYCKRITQAKRDLLSNSMPLPTDYTLCPGIVDHSTCVVVKVGRFVRSQNESPIDKEKDKKSITSRNKYKESKNEIVRGPWEWSVDSRMQLLFEKFHMGIAEGFTKQEALRQAQQYVRDKYGIYDWEDEAKS